VLTILAVAGPAIQVERSRLLTHYTFESGRSAVSGRNRTAHSFSAQVHVVLGLASVVVGQRSLQTAVLINVAATRIGLLAILSLGHASVSTAAPPDWRVAFGGAAIYSTQDSESLAGQISPGVAKPGIGGSAPGFLVFAETAATSILGIGFEVSETARFEGIQSTTGNFVSQNKDRHHDLIVSLLVHVHPRLLDRLRVDIAGGAGYVREDTLVQSATAPPLSNGPFGPFGPERSVTRDTIGGTVGVGIDFGLTRHLSVEPMVRAHFISRADIGSSGGAFGLSSAVLRFGIGLRASF
jgi:hypothetical protein